MTKIRGSIYKVITLVISFCTFMNTAVAQIEGEVILTSYLQQLEVMFEVRFSYDTDAVNRIKIQATDSTITLNKALQYLSKTTPFIYAEVDNRYITVTPIYGNYLCGRVLNSNTLQPIEGVAIRTNQGAITISNTYGFFVLPSNNNDSYTLSHIGYLTAPLNNNPTYGDCATAYLSPEWSQLNEVIIKTIFTEGVSKQAHGLFRIETKDFGLLPGQVDNDVLQIIQALPGVESVDETISNINIRGGTHDENLVLWNDIKMYQSGHFFGLISAFNPQITERVDVYKNGTHPRYGESVSGVISMQSKNSLPDNLEGAIGFNFINGSVFAEFPISEKFGVQVSGRSSANAAIKSPTYKTYSKRIFQDSEITNINASENGAQISIDDEFNFYDLSTRFLYDISEKSALRINFLGMDNRLTFTENIEESNQSKRSGLDQRSFAGGISWEQKFSDKMKTTLYGYGSYYLLKALNRDVFTTQELRQKNEILETGIKLDAQYTLTARTKIQAGYQFSEIGIGNEQDVNLPRFRSYKKDVLHTHAAYMNGLFTIATTQIQTGVRYNYIGKLNKGMLEPRISIFQPLGNGFSTELLGEFKSQTTTQRIDFQSDFLGIEKRRWVLADEEEIPIIQSKQASLGFQYDKAKWFLSVEGFYKQVEGITTSNQGFQNQLQFVKSTGSYDAYGSEFIINRKTKTFSVWLSYLYLKNRYTFDDLSPIEFNHNLDVNHSFTLAGSYVYRKLQIAMGIKWHSGAPYTRPINGNEIIVADGESTINFQEPNSSKLPSYFRTDLSAKYVLKISSQFDAKINIALLNLLNTKNTLNIRYALDTDEAGTSRVNEVAEFSLGFTPNFSFQLLF